MQLRHCPGPGSAQSVRAGVQEHKALTTKAQRHKEKKYNFVSLCLCGEKNCRGVGLIEVLISLLIITIGILGMAGVHSSSLQYNQSAYMQSQATFLATDMLDRILINSSLAKTGSDYQTGAEESEFSQCVQSDYPGGCETGNCTQQELAAYDILQWKFQLACQIPGSQGSISYQDSGDSRTYTIRLSFPDMDNRVPLGDIVVRGIL